MFCQRQQYQLTTFLFIHSLLNRYYFSFICFWTSYDQNLDQRLFSTASKIQLHKIQEASFREFSLSEQTTNITIALKYVMDKKRPS